MSLINDALKRARQVPPQIPQNVLPPLPPVAGRPATAGRWLIPTIVIFLVIAASLAIGWAMAHRSVRNLTSAPPALAVATAQPAVTVDPPVVAPPVIAKPSVVLAPEPPLLNPPDAPKLQGIFYSSTAPAAILDGKIVRAGDSFLQYRVTEITKTAVTLIGPGGQTIKLGMDH